MPTVARATAKESDLRSEQPKRVPYEGVPIGGGCDVVVPGLWPAVTQTWGVSTAPAKAEDHRDGSTSQRAAGEGMEGILQ